MSLQLTNHFEQQEMRKIKTEKKTNTKTGEDIHFH